MTLKYRECARFCAFFYTRSMGFIRTLSLVIPQPGPAGPLPGYEVRHIAGCCKTHNRPTQTNDQTRADAYLWIVAGTLDAGDMPQKC